jgi:hypothetical protein
MKIYHMKRIITSLGVLLGLLGFATKSFAQAWENYGSTISSVIFSPKIVIANDTAFIAYINPMNGNVEFRKNANQTWVNLGSFATRDDQFDLELGVDGYPLLATVQSSLNGSELDFFLTVRKYENGSVGITEASVLLGTGPNTSNFVDIFDLAVNPNDGLGVIFRYNNSYQTRYRSKVGTDIWSSSYNVLAPGGSSGIKNARLTYTSNGAVILSRNESTFGGIVNALVFHAFLHNTVDSDPTQVIAPVLSSSTVIEQYIELDTYDDEIYAVMTDAANSSTIYKISLNAIGNIGFTSHYVLGNTKLNPQIKLDQAGNAFIAYVEEAGTNYPGKVSVFDPLFEEEIVLGASNFNDAGNMVGEMSMAINDGAAYVFYQYGPPFNNAKVRKFGCPSDFIITYNQGDNIISVSGAGSGSTYEWFACGESTVLGTNSTFSPTQSGSYEVVVTSGNCLVASNCLAVVLDNSAGLNVSVLNDVNIFPNPASEVLYITNVKPGVQLTISDVSGKIHFSENVQNESLTIPCHTLQAGMYLVAITSTEQVQTKTILIQ